MILALKFSLPFHKKIGTNFIMEATCVDTGYKEEHHKTSERDNNAPSIPVLSFICI